ncbi:MAG: GTPase ObgE, partial [Planctomycetota bacterium]
GLIEGAAGGAGLGHDFLRHIERTRVILHLVDGAPLDGSDPVQNYRVIRGELAGYTAALDEKPEVIALNKNDLLSSEEAEALMKRFRTELQLGVDTETITLSGATGLGVNELLEVMWNLIPARSDPTVEKNIGWSKPASRDG